MQSNESVEFFNSHPFFREVVNPWQRCQPSVISVGRKKMLCNETRPLEPRLFIVNSGIIIEQKVTAKGKTIVRGFRGQGDILGEISVVENRPLDFTAMALSSAVCLGIERHFFQALAARQPLLWNRLAQLVSKRFRQQEKMLNDLINQTVRQRLIGLLLELARKFGVQDSRGYLIPKVFTQEMMSSCIWSSRETVTLALGEMKREGLLTKNNKEDSRQIIVPDLNQLVAVIAG